MMHVTSASAFLLAAGVALLGAASCGSAPDPKRGEPGSVLTLDARELEPGTIIDLPRAAADGSYHVEPLPVAGSRAVTLIEVLDVDELIVDTLRGREHVRIYDLLGRDPLWPAEMNEWMTAVGQPALEAWLREPGTWLFEFPPRGASGGWTCELPETDADGLRPSLLVRQDAAGTTVNVRDHAIAQGWGIGCTPWSAALELSPGLLLDIKGAEVGVSQLPAAQALLAEYRAAAAVEFARSPAEWNAVGAAELERVATALGWTPAAAVELVALDDDEALERFEEVLVEYNTHAQAWGEAELARLSKLNQERGLDAPPSLSLELDDPRLGAHVRVNSLAAYAPAGPTIYLLNESASVGHVLEHRLIHELLHQYQEERFDRNALFPSPGVFGALLEPHAEWHTTRLMRARHPELVGYQGIDYFWASRLFARLVAETGVSADDVMQRFYDDTWDAYVWLDVMEGTLSLQEYLFHKHEQTAFAGLDFRVGAGWPDEAVIVISNTSGEMLHAHFHGIWLLDISEDDGAFGTVRGAPFNALLPAGGELRVRLSDSDVLPRHQVLHVAGLFSPTPSVVGD